ncbi:hypothetical protein LZ023_38620 (plasmid) [Pseudomonas silvicola]|nr:hypothetical protein LZ023_38620 [Pseudomonas silvicola]
MRGISFCRAENIIFSLEERVLFKLKPLVISLLAAQGIMIPAMQTNAAVIQPFDPAKNDNKVGVFCVCNGSTQSLLEVAAIYAG